MAVLTSKLLVLQITEERMAQSLLFFNMGTWEKSLQKIRYGSIALLHICV